MAKSHFGWLLPLLALLLFAPFSAEIDMRVAQWFFPFHQSPFFDFLFNYAPYPAWVVALSALGLFLGTYVWPSLKPYRSSFAILVLTLAIGAGLIVHILLKDHWGRPRPRQVEQFGGALTFQPFYKPNFHSTEPAKSFPCGHCSMGFYFFAVALVCRQQGWPRAALFSLIFALLLGGLLGYLRMAQGGHFFSDVLVSALIMWLTAYGLFRKFT